MKTPKFGKVTESQVTDDNGSTVSIETNYQNGAVRLPRYRHVEDRIRVTSVQEEMTHYLRHCEEKIGKLKSNFYTEETPLGREQGWYYVVKCWTEVADD